MIVASVYNETLGNLATMSDQDMIEEINNDDGKYDYLLSDVEANIKIIFSSENKENTED